LPTSNLLKLINDFNDFKNLFPLHYHKHFSYIEKINNKIKQKYGYSEEGFIIFLKHLNKINALNWKQNKWIESHNKIKDYLFDYYLALFLYFKYNILLKVRKLLWIHEKSDNKEFEKILQEVGYKEEVLDHLFSLFTKIDEKSTLIYLEASKKDYQKKIDFKQDKINLDNFQDYLTNMLGGKK